MGERSRFPNKEISILSLRQHLLLSERSFMLVNDGGELVKTFRSGGDELRGLGVSGLLPLTEWGWVFLTCGAAVTLRWGRVGLLLLKR